MGERKWKPIEWKAVSDEDAEDFFKRTIPLFEGFELLLFSDGTYAGRYFKEDLGRFEEQKKTEGVRLNDRIPIFIDSHRLLAFFLAEKNYDFNLQDLKPQEPEFWRRFWEKDKNAYWEFREYYREKYWELVQKELTRHHLD